MSRWLLTVIAAMLCIVALILRGVIEFSTDALLIIQLVLATFYVFIAVYSLKQRKLYTSLLVVDVVLFLIFSPIYEAILKNTIVGLNVDTFSALWVLIRNHNSLVLLLFVVGTVLILGFCAAKLWDKIGDSVKMGLQEVFSAEKDDDIESQRDGNIESSSTADTGDSGQGAMSTSSTVAVSAAPSGKEHKQQYSILLGVLAVFIVLISIVISILFVRKYVSNTQLLDAFSDSVGVTDQLNGIINILFSFLVILSAVLCAITALIDYVLWLVSRIKRNFQKQDIGSILGLFSVMAAIFLAVRSNNTSTETLDGVTDILVKGDIFSKAIYFVILIPTFIFLWRVFIKAVNAGSSEEQGENFNTTKDIQKAAFHIWEIASGIVLGLLRFFRFVTSDFLEALIQTLEEED